jgi:hypothetical protein
MVGRHFHASLVLVYIGVKTEVIFSLDCNGCTKHKVELERVQEQYTRLHSRQEDHERRGRVEL